MDKCTGRRDITEIVLKIGLYDQSINLLPPLSFYVTPLSLSLSSPLPPLSLSLSLSLSLLSLSLSLSLSTPDTHTPVSRFINDIFFIQPISGESLVGAMGGLSFQTGKKGFGI